MVILNYTLSEEGKGEAYRKRDVHLSLSLRISFLLFLLSPPRLLTLLLSTRA